MPYFSLKTAKMQHNKGCNLCAIMIKYILGKKFSFYCESVNELVVRSYNTFVCGGGGWVERDEDVMPVSYIFLDSGMNGWVNVMWWNTS